MVDDQTFSTSSTTGTTDRRRRTILYAATTLLLIAVIAIVLGTTLPNRGGALQQQGGNPSSDHVEETILKVAIQGGAEFEDPESYQSKALEWLKTDTAQVGWSDARLVQRYALACIFYSTHNVRTIYTDSKFGTGVVYPWLTSVNWMTTASECDWFRVSCDNATKTVVEVVELHENRLTGSFPEEATLLTQLTRLDLFDNVVWNFGDEGNAWLGEMTNLRHLYLGNTNFEYDGIPTQISNLKNLEEFDCSYTLYFGPLKEEVFQGLDNLEYLDIGGNEYNSSVPASLAQLPSLEWLYMDFTLLEGNFDFLADMPIIFELWMDFNPSMSGTLPPGIGDVTSLASMSITETKLGGSIPTEMGNLIYMQQLWLYNNTMTGTVPTELGNLKQMAIFYINGNEIEGEVPNEVCDLTNAGSSALQGGSLTTLIADCEDEVTCECCAKCF